jgi:hypothetical protein
MSRVTSEHSSMAGRERRFRAVVIAALMVAAAVGDPVRPDPDVPGSNPGRPTNPQGSVASSSSSCANVSCVASAAPVPAASSASFDG